MLIGDVIVSAREIYPDLPSTLAPPSLFASSGSGTFPAGTYYIVATFFTAYGESAISNEVSVTIGASSGLSVTLSTPLGIIPSQLVKGRVYIGLAAGGESVYADVPLASINSAFDVTFPTDYKLPPTRSTAFLPDTDGRMVSAGTIYRWINEALNVAGYVCKGIPDMSGFQTFSGQGMYTMPGIWDKFENCWFDGYPVAYDARSGAFYRNVLSGITFIGILQLNADRQIFEFQPQPDRTGGTDSIGAGGVSINATTIPLTSLGQSFGISLGMAQIGAGPYPNCEIISYGSISAPGFIGCARGMGGTQQQAWPANTPVTELNFRFAGLRMANQTIYTPGQGLVTLQVPPGWQPALVDYLIGRFREAEQNSQGKGESIKSFTTFLKDYVRGTKQTAGPRQVGSSTPAGDGYPSASSGGRIIVP